MEGEESIMKIPLPDDGWALLRDPAKVSERLRRPVTNLAARLQPEIVKATAAEEPVLDPETFDQFQALNDLVIVALVEEWSFDRPVTIDSVGDLPGDAYDMLRRETAKHVNALLPDFSPNPDPASPTGP
jgi:hypothetical protein